MPDIHRERRVRWVEQQLAQLPGLDAKHRRFLSVPLMARGWHLFVSRSAPSPGNIAAFAVGRTGAYALVFTDDVPEHAALRSLRKRAEETFGGATGRPRTIRAAHGGGRVVDAASHPHGSTRPVRRRG